MVTRPYDHPAHTTLHMVAFQDQGSTSTSKVARWQHPATVVIDQVYGVVTDAAAAATDTYVIYSGTTSIGGYAIGTSTVGATWSVDGTDLTSDGTITAGAQVSFASFGTGASDITYVYHISPANTAI